MKKENRKLAQERRALERKKQEQLKKIKKGLLIGIPIAAVIAIVVIIAVISGSSSQNKNQGTGVSSQSNENTSGQEQSTGYSKDTSLTIKDGDTVNIDYVGSVDGVEFEGGNTNGAGTDLTIGSNTYIDDFEEQLIGHHPGDLVDVTVTFPEDYGQENLNGKEALFKVTINGIYE